MAVLSNLADIQRRKGDYQAADMLFRRGFAIRDKKRQAERPACLILLNNYGLLLRDKGDYAGAADYLRQALAFGEKLCGTNGPCTKRIRENLQELNSRRFQKQQN